LPEASLSLRELVLESDGVNNVGAADFVGHQGIDAYLLQHRDDGLDHVRLALVGTAQIERGGSHPAEGCGPREKSALVKNPSRGLLMLRRHMAGGPQLAAHGTENLHVVQGAAGLAVPTHQAIVHHLLDLR
jgi:hypothetical protein